MPKEFLSEDTSIKEEVSIQVFFLGYTPLSQEIYRKSVINNQLAVYREGEYRVFPVDYSIYDAKINQKAWEISGLKDTLQILEKNQDLYFTVSELPYRTRCFEELPYEMDTLHTICHQAQKENSFSYFMIDTGDVYRNLDLSNKIQLLMNHDNCYHIFLYHDYLPEKLSDKVTCYGNLKQIFTHDVIVDESLLSFAKTINKEYLKNYKEANGEVCTPVELEKENKESFQNASYFNRYSNIYLANNLRLKLNLLGLDYREDSLGENLELPEKHYGEYFQKDLQYDSYFHRSIRNAMLAQEHFRWNAYHLMTGYLPMKKERILIEKSGDDNQTSKQNKLKLQVKNNVSKKHACLTTYQGIHEVSSYLAEKANQILPGEKYSPGDFDYYIYDEMLMKVGPQFLKEKKHSIIVRF